MVKYNQRPKGLATEMAEQMIKCEASFRDTLRKIGKVFPSVFSEKQVDESIKRAKNYLRRSRDKGKQK